MNVSSRIQTDIVGCWSITWETGTCDGHLHHEYGDNSCPLIGSGQQAPKPQIVAITDICNGGGSGDDNGNDFPDFPNYEDGSSGGGGDFNTTPYTGTFEDYQAYLIELNRVFRLKLNASQLSWYDSNTSIGMELAKLYNEDKSIPHLNFLTTLIDLSKIAPENSFLLVQIIDFLKTEGSYSGNWNVVTETISDWNNPNIVKPTLAFKNNAKLNSIYNQAKTAANFQQYLKNFIPDASVAHLMFDVGVVDNPSFLAQTSPPQNYWINTIFNIDKDWNNIPNIVIAETFMHEIIHAEIYRKLLSLAATNGNINTNEITQKMLSHNYPGLFDYYVRYTKGNTDAQHNLMAASYVTIIVNFLKQINGTKYSDLEYKTIVWLDFKGTTAWNNLTQTERDLYQETWNQNYNIWEK